MTRGQVLDPITAPQNTCPRPQPVPGPFAAFCPHPAPLPRVSSPLCYHTFCLHPHPVTAESCKQEHPIHRCGEDEGYILTLCMF